MAEQDRAPGSDHPVNLKRSRIAIYLQLADLFRSRIASGHWPVGGRIPNIDDLAEEFGVARGTIRQAFDALEEEGLVERLRAKGSFVKRAPHAGRVHRLEMDWGSIIKAHQGSDIVTLDTTTVPVLPDVLRNGGTAAPGYRRFRRLHRRDGEPHLLGTSYLDERLYRKLAAERFETEPLLQLLQEAAAESLGSARQVLTISTADVDTAALLEIAVNAPVAIMRRAVLSSDDVLVYASEGTYRGDSVRLEIDLR
ncbi:GntR family transcriptional regulator [Amorphus coralli]|uniref:GntR family transcriptional regulator n=1 Tax=Amorphus coralli TaxID=340680 RepID=UPI00035EECF0|nr:GntR family transcriptional regulator [Amorphus coralli]